MRPRGESRLLAPIVLVAVVAAGFVGSPAGPVGVLYAQDAPSIWSRLPVDGEIIASTRSPVADCQAAATKATLYVADGSGSLLWQWKFRTTNRFIHVMYGSTVALAPDCQHAVLVGNVAYKYVWAVEPDGGTNVRAQVLPTVGTPLHAAFSLDGMTIAVVTAARRGYLLTPALTVKWSGATARIPIRWPSQAGGAVGGESVNFSRAEVDQLLGALLWGWHIRDDLSEDGRWRVVTQQENRGRGAGSVEFFGPDAGGFHGRLLSIKPRWRHAAGCVSAEVSVDGEFAIVSGDFVNTFNQCEGGDGSTKVFDRNGRVVASLGLRPLGSDYSVEEREKLVAAVGSATGKPLRFKE